LLVTRRALSNAVSRLRLFRDGEGLVCPFHRRRMSRVLQLRTGGGYTRLCLRLTNCGVHDTLRQDDRPISSRPSKKCLPCAQDLCVHRARSAPDPRTGVQSGPWADISDVWARL
jgi:hypothetical protein